MTDKAFNKPSKLYTAEWILLLFMIGAAAWLRLHGLGELSFYGDEDYTALAVKNILESGVSAMPSGMNYFRAIPFSYTAALSASLQGINEYSLRLPSAIFGVLAVPIFYLLAKRISGLVPSIIATLLLVFSAWHIDISREARMYSMFITFTMITVYFYILAYFYDKKEYKIISVISAIFTITIHQLGVLIVLIWGIPLIFKYNRVNRRATVIITTFILGFISLYYNKVKSFKIPGAAVSSDIAVSNSAGLIDTVKSLALGYLNVIPDYRVFYSLVDRHADLVVIIIAVVITTISIIWMSLRKKMKYPKRLFFAAIIILLLASLNLFSLILVLVSLLFFVDRRYMRDLLNNKFVHCVLGVTVAILIYWIYYGLIFFKDISYGELTWITLLRKSIKNSFSYPVLHLIMYAEAFPIMTAMCCFGSFLWAFRSNSEIEETGFEISFFSWFWLILFALGFASPWIALRYTVIIYPFYLMIYAWTIYQLINFGYRKIRGKSFNDNFYHHTQSIILGTVLSLFLVAFPVINEQHGIKDAVKIRNLTYGNQTSSLLRGKFSHPDHKGAGHYVAEHLTENDIIIVMDLFQQFYYIGRVDYWLREKSDVIKFSYTKGIHRYDIYTNTRVIDRTDELKNIINQLRERQNIWLVISAEEIKLVPPGVYDFLSDYEENVKFIGRDGHTRVYLF